MTVSDADMVTLDIETIPNADLINSMPEPTVKYGNTKDPILRAEIERKARISQLEGMALNPLYGRVCCVGLVKKEFDLAKCINDFSDYEEKKVIKFAFSSLSRSNNQSPQLITWNGMNFDMPFLYKRAMILGVDLLGAPPLSYWMKRYTTIPHCDLMLQFAGYNKYEKLDNVAKIVLGEKKNDIDFKKFPQMIKDGKQKEIEEYCMQDVKLTDQLAQKADWYLF